MRIHASLCDDHSMEIAAPCVVSLTWRLADAQGAEIDELREPVEFFYGGDDLLAKVEEALAGQETGYSTTLHLEPEHAFGDYDADKVCFEDRALFPADLSEGMQLEGLPPGARTPDMPADALYTVTEIYPTHVVLDGNHPLAGMALRLQLRVHDVREATDEEIERRSVGGGELLSVVDTPPGEPRLH
jgi:FKBP-type peptidyl-prolyl cis-trans isomerase SlyD